MTLWNGQHQGLVQAASIISSFYCDATNLLQADNYVIITSAVTRRRGKSVAILADLLLDLANFSHCLL